MKRPRPSTTKIYTVGFKDGEAIFDSRQGTFVMKVDYRDAERLAKNLNNGYARQIYQLVPVKTFKRGEKVS